ncbi:MAG: hypothetical protein WCK74_00240 [Gemmatimonadaceae bacterium]
MMQHRLWRSGAMAAAIALSAWPSAPMSARLLAQPASATVPTGRDRALDALPWRGDLSMVKAAIPLATGLLVLDGDEIHLIRPNGSDTKVVREGDGPLELRKPKALFPYRGDSVLAVGNDASVVLVLTPTGAPARTMMLREVRSALMAPRGSSRAGALSYLAPRMGQQVVDSADVVLVDPDRKQSRTVTALWQPGVSTSGKLSRNLGKPTDEALLTGSGVLVVYRVTGQRLELFDATGARIRQLTMPGRPRERSAAEQKQMDAAAAFAKARMDSMVQQMDPKVRALMADAMSATTSNMMAGEVPAYTPGSLVALSEEVVAMVRSHERGVSDAQYDWVHLRTGAMGSFALPAAVQVVGAGPRGVALARVTMPDGEMQVATLSLAALLSTR